ncbi:MAG: hypothetical protein OXG67_09805 [bacterium]|nr:hypothetical protein [bacterium]
MSDERRTPENQTGSDDQALGKALGSAIRDRVDTPAVRPPVSSIAERAAARAKARNTRRAVVGIAASAVLVVGGISAWNALDSDQPSEVIVVDDPTASPAPQPSAEPAPAPTSEAPGEPEDPPQTDPEAGSEPQTPESLSTIPVVAWTEHEPTQAFGAEISFVDHMVSVGDGRVLAQVYGSAGDQVMVTENGRDWTVIPMPPDLAPERFDIASALWLVSGTGIGSSGAFDDHRALFSDDQGATWTDLALDIGSQGEATSVAAAVVSGNNMVIATENRVHTDIASVIVARGLVPDKESIRGWMSLEGDTVSFTRDESSAPESFELTAEEKEALYGGDRSFVRLYHSTGGPAEPVAEYAGSQVTGYGTTDGFHLLMLANEGALKLASPGGRQWSQTPLSTGDGVPVDQLSNYYGSTNQTIWTSGGAASNYRVERLDGVYTAPLAAELPEGIAHVSRFSVGPAGIAIVAVPGSFPDPDLDLRVTKDGYELRYDEPKGGFSLWDLTDDTDVYVFDAESEQANMLPEGIRILAGDDGDTELLIFEDPETGEHLVSFTREELEPWANDESLLAAPDIRPRQPEAWVGWSADGASWVWQTLSEAFGLADLTDAEKELTNVDLAVGTDYLIARVQVGVADPSETPSENGDGAYSVTYLPPRWFIATVE